MEPRLPEKPLSLSANVTDPKDGKCYARGQERCSQNGCQPTPGGYYIHARLYDKAAGLAHQGTKDRESWDYDPLAPRPRRHRATSAAADPSAGRRFGGGRTVAPDPAPDPAPVSRFGAWPPAGKPRTGRPSGSGKAAQQAGQPESLLERFRRWI